MVQRKNDVTPVITVQGNVLETHDRNYSYKYLGKSLSLSGEDSAQVEEFIKTYLDLVKKISDSSLPLALKASALNNMALAKILHHFYNTRLSEEQLEDIDKSVTKTVRDVCIIHYYNQSCDLFTSGVWWYWSEKSVRCLSDYKTGILSQDVES